MTTKDLELEESLFGGVYEKDVGSTAYDKGDFYVESSGWSGFCLSAGEANKTVVVQTEGAKKFKKTAATVAVAKGDKLYSTDNEATVNKTSASRTLIGYAVSASPSGTKNVMVDLWKGT